MDDIAIAIAMQLYYEGFNPATTQFFLLVYPAFKKYEILNYTNLSKIAYSATSTCQTHMSRLEARGVLNRVHYRGWSLNSNLRNLIKEELLLRGLNGGNKPKGV